MTVKELIEALSKQDPETEVMIGVVSGSGLHVPMTEDSLRFGILDEYGYEVNAGDGTKHLLLGGK
jgi:hypothetical protein